MDAAEHRDLQQRQAGQQLDRDAPAARLAAALADVRTGVLALDPPDLVAHSTARYEHAGALGELRAFVASGERARLRTARERFARMLVMLSHPDRHTLTQAVEEAIDTAEELSREEREVLAGSWADLGSAARAVAPDGVADQAPIPTTTGESLPHDEIELIRRVMARIPSGLERWTWETPSQTRTRAGRCWHVDNEMHVQNLLWLALSPALPDLRYEETLPSVGRLHPRADLALPRLQLAIEVKFVRREPDFARVMQEIAADASLYTGARNAAYSRMMVLVWDDTRSSERHAQLVAGMRSLRGVVEAVVVSRPGLMHAEVR